jgi:hypothetical protein
VKISSDRLSPRKCGAPGTADHVGEKHHLMPIIDIVHHMVYSYYRLKAHRAQGNPICATDSHVSGCLAAQRKWITNSVLCWTRGPFSIQTVQGAEIL